MGETFNRDVAASSPEHTKARGGLIGGGGKKLDQHRARNADTANAINARRRASEEVARSTSRPTNTRQAERSSTNNRQKYETTHVSRRVKAAELAVAAVVERPRTYKNMNHKAKEQKPSLAWGATKIGFKIGRSILRTKAGAGAAFVGGIMLIAPYLGNEDTLKSEQAKVETVIPGSDRTEDIMISETAARMLEDVKPYDVVDFWSAHDQVVRDGQISEKFGEQISVEDTMRYMYAGGWRGDDLIMITSIAQRESSRYPGAIGDVGYNGAERQSVGLLQITCGADGIECSGIHDPAANMNPLHAGINSKALSDQAAEWWGYDERFQPWGWYQAHSNKPDPALVTYLQPAQEAYKTLELVYGDLSV